MNVAEAVSAITPALAERWHATDGYVGTYLAGSALELGSRDAISLYSDIDVLVVLEDSKAFTRPGKSLVGDVTVEVSLIDAAAVMDADAAAGTYWLAPTVSGGVILDAKDSRMSTASRQVRRQYFRRSFVTRRCRDVVRRAESHLSRSSAAGSHHKRLEAWLFGSAVQCHLPLVASGRNPTGRLRYLRAQEQLARYGMSDIYADLLTTLGCADWTSDSTTEHFGRMKTVFDDVCAYPDKYPTRLSTEIAPWMRRQTVEGTKYLIDDGRHREAVFWIGATLVRCRELAAARDVDTTVMSRIDDSIDSFFGDLGICNSRDLCDRVAASRIGLATALEVALSLCSRCDLWQSRSEE